MLQNLVHVQVKIINLYSCAAINKMQSRTFVNPRLKNNHCIYGISEIMYQYCKSL